MSSESIKHSINFLIDASIEEMTALIADHQRYKQTLTGNKNIREHIGMHAKYMSTLFADERRLHQAMQTLSTLNNKYGE